LLASRPVRNQMAETFSAAVNTATDIKRHIAVSVQ